MTNDGGNPNVQMTKLAVNSGTWLQRLWWKTRDLYQQLKPGRFSIGVVIVGLFVFTRVAQGVEVLRTVGEGVAAGSEWYVLRVVLFFVALMLWAVCSWYACRVLLYFDFPNAPPPGARSKWAEANVPRLLGIAPIAILALGFWTASRQHAPEDKTQYWLLGFAALCVLLAIVFYVLLAYRRQIFRLEAIATVKHVHELSRGTKVGVAVVVFISLSLFIAFTIAPVVVAQIIGMGTILLLAASSWVALGSFLVFLGARWQFPVICSLVVLAIIFSLWNDNHLIRTVVPARPVQRDSVIAAFEKWHTMVQKFPAPHPLYIVATEGGGIRAAYWTGIVLSGLQDINPNFATHLFAISGVSGGSLGAVVFDALVAENDGRSYQANAHEMLSRDFLSPALAAMLYPDLVQRFLPVPIAYFDRARALELGWEKAWRDRMGNDRFSRSFVDLWPADPHKWVPALFLNGTSVEKGNRIITSNLRVTDSFFDVEDAAAKLSPDARATEAGCHIPLSTAAHMSARFTYVSPAGRFPDGTYIVDGGYFENSGATTALEIVTRINEWCAFKHISDVDPKLIMISNNPRRPPIAPAKAGPKKERTLSKPETVHGGVMREVTSPLQALLNARDARGTFAQKAIAHQQRRFKAADAESPSKDQPESLSRDIFYFSLEDRDVPLPLGWMLSDAAAKSIRAQWNFDGVVVRNKTAADEISRPLPPAAP
jgi:hypothetical protein